MHCIAGRIVISKPRRGPWRRCRMGDRPYTLLSCSMSIDGFIDGTTESRLVLSNDLDFDRVDEERARVDAILAGATTIRNDNPRLLVRDPDRRRERVARGQPPHPVKVTLTPRGRLDPSSRFFADDGAAKLVYAGSAVADHVRGRLGAVSEVVDAG